MYARWLVFAQALLIGLLIYFADISSDLRFQGTVAGFDGARDIESQTRYFNWHLRAREAFLLVVILWIAALLLAVYSRVRWGESDFGRAKFGSPNAILVTIILPIVGVWAAFIFGLDVGR